MNLLLIGNGGKVNDLKIHFEENGFTVTFLADYSLALATALCTPQPEIIVLYKAILSNDDWWFAGRDLKIASASKDIPIVFITEEEKTQDWLRARGVGIEYVFSESIVSTNLAILLYGILTRNERWEPAKKDENLLSDFSGKQ
jgi:hypothetical protein